MYIAFAVACGSSLMGLAIPNYFLFDLKMTAQAAALTITFFSFGYAIAPLLISRLVVLMGKRITLVFCTGGISIISILYLQEIDANQIFLLRFFDGFLCGTFWSSIEYFIPQFITLENSSEKRISGYNLSWNIGTILAFILGNLVVFFIQNNYVAMLTGTFFFFSSIPFAFLLRIPKNKQKSPEEPLELEPLKSDKRFFGRIAFIVPFTAIILYSIGIQLIPFLMTVKMEQHGYASFYVYSFALGRSVSSGMASKQIEKIKNKKYFNLIIVAAMTQAFLAIGLIFVIDAGIYIIYGIILGLTTIVLYALPLKMILDKNSEENTMKYSAFFHFTLGTTSGLLPYISSIFVNDAFDFLFIVIAVCIMILVMIFNLAAKRAKFIP